MTEEQDIIPDVPQRTKFEITVEDVQMPTPPPKASKRAAKPKEAEQSAPEEPTKVDATAPAMSPQTVLEMEAGRACLKGIAAEQARLRAIVEQSAEKSEEKSEEKSK